MEILLNGQSYQLVEGATVAALVEALKVPATQVAVEVNLELVPRAEHAACRLRAGDRVEVVTLVGGG